MTYYKKFAAIIALLGITGMSGAYATDSTGVKAPEIKPAAAQAYLLDSNKYSTTRTGYFDGQYDVRLAVHKRCSSTTTPTLTTSIDSIQAYAGLSQSIQGVNNTLHLDPRSYIISGMISAPVNVGGAADNGVTVRWEIWCEPNQTA
jgi:hypothetical protein